MGDQFLESQLDVLNEKANSVRVEIVMIQNNLYDRVSKAEKAGERLPQLR